MSEKLLYLDSSALVKLVLPEPETEALFAYLSSWSDLVSSEIAVVEVLRATRRVSLEAEAEQRARRVLESVHLLAARPEILNAASQLEPPSLSSLDALHLASAIALDTDLGGFVAYDKALLTAAVARGLPTVSPTG